jgi:hypothetical protein
MGFSLPLRLIPINLIQELRREVENAETKLSVGRGVSHSCRRDQARLLSKKAIAGSFMRRPVHADVGHLRLPLPELLAEIHVVADDAWARGGAPRLTTQPLRS